MMSAYANSLQKPEGFELYVRKFRAICVLHDVQVGSRRDLPGFLQRLLEDRPLAMDFWKLTSKLSNRENGDLSDDQMLAVVLEGVTGGEAGEDSGEEKRSVDNLRAMLAGVDIQGPDQIQSELLPLPDDAGVHRAEIERDAQGVEDLTSQSYPGATIVPEALDNDATRSAASPPPLPTQLDETRMRNELNSLVKEYFDNIDKRISKLEPHGDEEISMEPPANTVPLPRREDASARAMEEPRLRSGSSSRLVLEPTQTADDSFPSSSSKRIPLESYSEPRGFGRAVAILVAVLALAGTAFAGYRYRAPLRERTVNLAHAVEEKVQSIEHRRGTAAAASQSTPAVSPEAIAPVEQAPPQALPQSLPKPPQVRTDVVNPRPTLPAQSQVAASIGADAASDHNVTREREQALADTISSADDAGAVRVDAAVMEDNLIVSRVPAYPDAAKANRIEGTVVIQAIISKEGKVRRVHVLEGDSRLRAAAIESVFKRRYTPYLLNGEPVEVSTAITVNFNLDQ